MTQTSARQLNSLWIARKKAGLAQKVVARLLEQKSTSQLSEYERGKLLPNLRTAFKLSIIYDTPVSDLYCGLYERAKQDVDGARRHVPVSEQRNLFYEFSQRAHFGH